MCTTVVVFLPQKTYFHSKSHVEHKGMRRISIDCTLLYCYPKYMFQKQPSNLGKVRYGHCKTMLNSLSFDFLIFRPILQYRKTLLTA